MCASFGSLQHVACVNWNRNINSALFDRLPASLLRPAGQLPPPFRSILLVHSLALSPFVHPCRSNENRFVSSFNAAVSYVGKRERDFISRRLCTRVCVLRTRALTSCVGREARRAVFSRGSAAIFRNSRDANGYWDQILTEPIGLSLQKLNMATLRRCRCPMICGRSQKGQRRKNPRAAGWYLDETRR